MNASAQTSLSYFPTYRLQCWCLIGNFLILNELEIISFVISAFGICIKNLYVSLSNFLMNIDAVPMRMHAILFSIWSYLEFCFIISSFVLGSRTHKTFLPLFLPLVPSNLSHFWHLMSIHKRRMRKDPALANVQWHLNLMLKHCMILLGHIKSNDDNWHVFCTTTTTTFICIHTNIISSDCFVCDMRCFDHHSN